MKMHLFLRHIATYCTALFALSASAAPQKFVPNYDESKLPPYTLPNVLQTCDGKDAKSALEWLEVARPKIISALNEDFFGKRPPRPSKMSFKVVEQGDAFGGAATRKQIKVTVGDKDGERDFTILMYAPKGASEKSPTPAFVCLNFKGNQATTDDKNVIMPTAWMRGLKDNKATEETRGIAKSRWPFEEVVKRGYALATVYYGEIYPDKEKFDGTDDSIYTIFDKNAKALPAIAAWSWGLSRMIDVLENMPEIDATKVTTVGHSRLGKTSLLTGAMDKRVAICVSNNSGCMGAALSRRMFGETPERIATAFPFWFSKNLDKYAKEPNTMPIDQHQMLAAIAPRPLYVASATKDEWADPKGELMALIEAGKVYELFGAKNLPTLANFVEEKPFHGDIAYHLRIGKHDITVYDWLNYCDFADMHFGVAKK